MNEGNGARSQSAQGEAAAASARGVRRRRMRHVAYAVAALGTAAVLAGCGGYFYEADVQGRIVDAESDAGINDAVVRVYLTEPASADAAGYVAQSATFTANADGTYQAVVRWTTEEAGVWGGEGDIRTIWLGVVDDDYVDRIVRIDGLLSGETNTVPTITLERATFRLAALEGRLVDATGAGVNGVTVELDFPVVEGAGVDDDPSDEVVQTATSADGTTGVFRFEDLEWNENNTTDGSGAVTVTIRVNDADYGAEEPGHDPDAAEYGVLALPPLEIVPGETTRTVAGPTTVYRLPRTEFTTQITGRLFERIDTANRSEDVPVQGVEVTLTWTRRLAGDETATETRIEKTNAQGVYTFAGITWIDTAPGDYDAADERDASTVGAETTGIDQGEDGLVVNIAYADAPVAGGTLAFSDESLTDARIVSNPSGGQNRMTDVRVAATPE